MIHRTFLALTTMMLLCGATGVAFAAHPDNGPGCGLGKLAWGSYPSQQSIGPQLLQVTTNATFFTQTFGISSGTSGCTNDGTIFASEKVNVFVAINIDDISRDMAQGQGEHLTSLATLMNIPTDQHQFFFSMAQQKYTNLIQAGDASPEAVIKAMHSAMSNQSVLAKARLTSK